MNPVCKSDWYLVAKLYIMSVNCPTVLYACRMICMQVVCGVCKFKCFVCKLYGLYACGLLCKLLFLACRLCVLYASSSVLYTSSSVLYARSSVLYASSSVLYAGSSVLYASSSVLYAGSSVLYAGSSVLYVSPSVLLDLIVLYACPIFRMPIVCFVCRLCVLYAGCVSCHIPSVFPVPPETTS